MYGADSEKVKLGMMSCKEDGEGVLGRWSTSEVQCDKGKWIYIMT